MFRGALRSFLPNRINKDLFPGFLCFCMAATAVVLGAIASETHWKWLAWISLLLLGLALLGGFCSMVYFIVQMFRRPQS